MDGGGYTTDLGLRKTRIFFREGLDSPNHVDPVQEIRFCAQVRGGVGRPRSRVKRVNEMRVGRDTRHDVCESATGQLSSIECTITVIRSGGSQDHFTSLNGAEMDWTIALRSVQLSPLDRSVDPNSNCDLSKLCSASQR